MDPCPAETRCPCPLRDTVRPRLNQKTTKEETQGRRRKGRVNVREHPPIGHSSTLHKHPLHPHPPRPSLRPTTMVRPKPRLRPVPRIRLQNPHPSPLLERCPRRRNPPTPPKSAPTPSTRTTPSRTVIPHAPPAGADIPTSADVVAAARTEGCLGGDIVCAFRVAAESSLAGAVCVAVLSGTCACGGCCVGCCHAARSSGVADFASSAGGGGSEPAASCSDGGAFCSISL
jgi:hypothetical protein